MKSTAIIAAGGSGTRLQNKTPKQFIPLLGTPMLFHTLQAFEKAQTISDIILVLPESDQMRVSSQDLSTYNLHKVQQILPGGVTRQDSVGCGLEAIKEGVSFVAIHDAARCLITPELIDLTVSACEGWKGAILALPVRDTLKKVDKEKIIQTQPRKDLWAMQTPQVFPFPFIREAYRKAQKEGIQATDDASLAEFAGGRIRVVQGSTLNFKVTFEEDLKLAEMILQTRR